MTQLRPALRQRFVDVVWGCRIGFVCVMGIVVAALSTTRVSIWWRKQRSRSGVRHARVGPAPVP
jgi:hypothetical protein